MRGVLFGLMAIFSISAQAAPPPPPAPADAAFQDAFFAALPLSLPAEDTSKLEAMVAGDLKVYVDGKLAHSTRKDWLAWLQAMAGPEKRVKSFSMSREEFFFQPDDRIMVREFWMPLNPQIAWHPEFPHRLVSYKFADHKLIRIDYGAWLRPMDRKPGEKN